MKKILFFLVSLFNVIIASAQLNVVPNCSFEQYTSCPTALSQIPFCTGWLQYCATSDYFNTCGSGAAAVPTNTFGTEPAAHGNAYIGMINRQTYREMVTRPIASMIPGALYEVSVSVSLADGSQFATDDLGIFFYDQGPATLGISAYSSVVPQVKFASAGYITNTAGWVRLVKTFTADSAYDNIAIGCFSPTMNLINNPGGVTNNHAYLYVDSVVVKLAYSIIIGNLANPSLCRGDFISVPFTITTSSGYYQPSNVFTLQLSNAAGSFANPVNIGTLNGNTSGTLSGTIPMGTPAGTGYRLRIKSSNAVDSSLPNTVDISIGNIIPVKPVANSNSPVCTGNPLNFTASTTTPGVTWSWTGPQTYVSTQQNPSILLPATNMSGDYIVEASIYGCKSEKDTVSVIINQTPNTIFAGSNGPICAGNILGLNATNTLPANATYSWSGPAGYSSNVQNPNITNTTTAMSGNYTVTATNSGCSVTDMVNVLVQPTPVVSAFANTPICSGQVLHLTSAFTGTPSANISWSGPLAYTSNQANPDITAAAVGMTGTYAVTASLNGCSTTASIPVTVNLTPATPIASSNSPICNNMQLQLNANSATPGVTYQWAGPNGFNSNLQNPALAGATTANSGTYTVVAKLGSCTAQATTNVLFNPTPYLGCYASPNDTVCEGTLVTFVTVPMNGVVNPQFQWFRNTNAIQNATNITYTGPYATGDSFYCRTYNQDICGNTITLYSNKVGMVVNNAVTSLSATISSSPAQPLPGQPVSFTASVTSGGYTPKFQWKKNNIDVFGAVTPNWNANNLSPFDEITCFVTTSDTCASPKTTTSNKIVVNFPTAINELENIGNDIQLYPNPSDGSFKISTQNLLIQKIEALNITGQMSYSQTIAAPTDEITIDLGKHLYNGLYILRIHADKGVLQRRFSIER